MLNQSILMGRLVKDPETRFLQGSNNSVTRFTLAVELDYKQQGEERAKADFINCVAWNSTGKFISKYFSKGSMIAVVGRIETDSYTDSAGQKVYTTVVKVDKASFTGEKIDNTPEPCNGTEDFMNIPDGIDDLPFN